MNLTTDQLNSLLAQGWIKQGGPYSTQSQCLNNCGSSSSSSSRSSSSGGIIIGCCPDPIPSTLYLTLTGTGDCNCFNGIVVLTWNAGQSQWNGVSNNCSTQVNFHLKCNGSTIFGMGLISDSPTCVFASGGTSWILNVGASTCSPFNLVFGPESVTVCCTGDITGIVTT
jgi:hypothetical protein